MHLGIALVGVGVGAFVGLAVERQRRRERRTYDELRSTGRRSVARVVAVEATGRFASFRRVTLELDGGRRIVETISAVETSALAIAPDAPVDIVVAAAPRADGSPDARLVRDGSVDRDRPVGVAVGVVLVALALAVAAVV